jgi:amino acid adenylation domain-containing protein
MQLKDVEDFYPLSPLQQGLLFHTLSEPDSRMYFNQTLATLRGDLDVQAFGRAWQQVVDRHPILRTFFVWEGVKQPVQVVNNQASMPLDVQDWRGLQPAERKTAIDQLRHDDLEQGFDLSQAPLMRARLLRTGEDTHDLFWTFHHILMDGWSMFAVLGQLFSSYDALVEGRNAEIKAPRPYRDHIAWLAHQSLPAAETYWRRTLDGFGAPTPLPCEPSAQPLQAGDEEFAALELFLSEETSRAIETLSQRQHVTLNTVLQGAWALLLGRHAGEQDVVFGTVVSGRPAELSGVQAMVGLFINTLPVRVSLPAERPVGEWLHDCQSAYAEMREYEYSPLVEVQGWSDVPRGTPLFDSIFLFENYHKDSPLEEMCTHLQMENVQWFERHNFPLAALAIPGEQLALKIIYQTDRYAAETIERLLGQWGQLLQGMAADPARRLADLSLLTTAEHEQLVSDWSGSVSDYPRDATIHELFEREVDRAPDAIALTFCGTTLSYAELDRRANQLAHWLQRQGVGPEVPVGLCMQRSLELLVAILGVLKAGGAYVALDPDYPAERLALMLDDTRPAALLTQSQLASSLPPCEAPTLCLDTEWDAIAKESEERPGADTGPENLAYVIYTSGSTGRPKGTLVPHRAVVRLVKNTDFATFDAEQVFLQFATVSFDASTLELWGGLLNGGRLVIFPPGKPALDELGQVVRDEGVTTLWLTAGLFHQLVEHDPKALTGVTQLFAGGDVLSVSHVKQALDALPGCTLINGYGPTENTTFTCCHRMTSAEAIDRFVPIGRPIANTSVYVLDDAMRPVPMGVVGDLYTGGDGVSRGYLDHPAITAERFVPDPFSSRPGARMYATGDQARYLPDGTLEFLGRNDQQVKLRGFRIELGEIEAVLATHADVTDSVIMAREDTPGDKRLVAYVIPATGQQPGTETLRGFLQQHLPDFMIPSAFLTLDSFPLTANGKVDRRSLPAPEGSRPELETSYVAPEAHIERTIAGIWQAALGLTEVGIHDNFFDLGGHSLHLIAVHGKLKTELGTKIPMVDMFRFPTVATLAQHLEADDEEQPTKPSDSTKQLKAGRSRLADLQKRRRGRTS